MIAAAPRRKAFREKHGKALRGAMEILDPTEYPEWDTTEKVSAWVHDSRAAANRHAEASGLAPVEAPEP